MGADSTATSDEVVLPSNGLKEVKNHKQKSCYHLVLPQEIYLAPGKLRIVKPCTALKVGDNLIFPLALLDTLPCHQKAIAGDLLTCLNWSTP